jgi:hypothetical protein
VALVILLAGSWPAISDTNASLYLIDSQFQGMLTRVYSMDPDSGALLLRADLGTSYTPVLGMAAASKTVLYLAGTDTGIEDRCQGDISCLLVRVELDPVSTTPAAVSLVGTILEDGQMLAGITAHF